MFLLKRISWIWEKKCSSLTYCRQWNMLLYLFWESSRVTQIQLCKSKRTDSILIILVFCWHKTLVTTSFQFDRVPESCLQSNPQHLHPLLYTNLVNIVCLSFLLSSAFSEWLPLSCSSLRTWITIWFWLKPDGQLCGSLRVS